jgi:hypothetical protein
MATPISMSKPTPVTVANGDGIGLEIMAANGDSKNLFALAEGR